MARIGTISAHANDGAFAAILRNAANEQYLLPLFCAPIHHPARFSKALLPLLAAYLRAGWLVLDPFAGVGGLARLGFTGARFVLNEIEWNVITQAQGKCRVVGNALHLPFADETFDAVVTSPTYGNRMADHHCARDASRRNTYYHAFGGVLHADNTGLLHFGAAYCERHVRAWGEAVRVLKRGGRFVLNVSDHIRGGRRVYVAKWHLDTLRGMGLTLCACHTVKTPRLRWGANRHLRCAAEYIFVLNK